MGYRPSSAAPVTRWARHLDQVMRERGWSRVRLFEEVGADLGYAPKSRSALLPLLADKEPAPEQAAILRKHFGEPPEAAAPEPTASAANGDTVSAALASLTESIAGLVAEIRADREARQADQGRLRDLEDAVGEIALRLQRVEAPDTAPGRGAPRVKAG